MIHILHLLDWDDRGTLFWMSISLQVPKDLHLFHPNHEDSRHNWRNLARKTRTSTRFLIIILKWSADYTYGHTIISEISELLSTLLCSVATIKHIPEPNFQILFLDGRYVLTHMTMEWVTHVWSIWNILDYKWMYVLSAVVPTYARSRGWMDICHIQLIFRISVDQLDPWQFRQTHAWVHLYHIPLYPHSLFFKIPSTICIPMDDWNWN